MTTQKNPSSLPPPYRSLEAVRGIASLWVVAFHATALMLALNPAIANALLVRVMHKGFLGVEVFFVVSGYCIANAACSVLAKPKPLVTYSYARVRRIFPPCWASLGLFALAAIIATVLQKSGQRPDSYLASLDLGHQSFAFYFSNLTLTQIVLQQPFISIVCWTLCYEIAFYAIVGLALFFVLKSIATYTQRTQVMLAILHLLTLACCGLLLVAPRLLPYPLDLWSQFGMGVALFHLVSAPRSTLARAAVVSIFGLTAIFLISSDVPIGYKLESSRWSYATALLAALVLLTAYRFDQKLFRLLPVRVAAFVGSFSYSLYLVNFLVVSGLMIFARKLPFSNPIHIAAIFGITALVLIPAYIFYYLFERPFIGSRRKAPRPVPSPVESPTEALVPAALTVPPEPIHSPIPASQT